MKFKKIEETTAATLTFKGQYSLLPDANEEIIRWITDNHYRLDGKRFNICGLHPPVKRHGAIAAGFVHRRIYEMDKSVKEAHFCTENSVAGMSL